MNLIEEKNNHFFEYTRFFLRYYMLYRQLGSTGEKISILGFGCMRLPVLNGQYDKVDIDRAIPLIRDAIDKGVNYLDTAYPYHNGQSETVIAEALKEGYREKVFIADKLPSWLIQKREDMDHYLQEQLKRLQTEQIDFYLLHSIKEEYWASLKSLGVLEFLDNALADGRIKYTGFSFHGEIELFFDVIDSYEWDMCQVQYNIVDANYQAGIEGIRYASNKGVGVVIMEPLRGGTLVKTVPSEVQDIWDQAPIKRSPAEWALKYLWDLEDIDTVLSGMTRNEDLEENLKIADTGYSNSLLPEEKDIIKEVRLAYKERVEVNCNQCGYCMPCPSGVNIPGNFQQLNYAHMFKDVENSRMNYYMLLKEDERAPSCTECGECEKLCPQMVPIQKTLKKVVETFEN
jgi:predicted aldo/keto reductase-like oxidoreductase